MNVLEYWESLSELRREQDRQWQLSLEAERNAMKANIFGYDADQIQAMKETKDFESYREGFRHGLDMKDGLVYHVFGYPVMEVINLIQQHEEKKMARRIISKKDLDILFPNEPQKAAFLRMVDGLIVVEKEPNLSEIQKVLCAIMTEIEVRGHGPDYGKITPGYISAYGSTCVINGLMGKGYKIVPIT